MKSLSSVKPIRDCNLGSDLLLLKPVAVQLNDTMCFFRCGATDGLCTIRCMCHWGRGGGRFLLPRPRDPWTFLRGQLRGISNSAGIPTLRCHSQSTPRTFAKSSRNDSWEPPPHHSLNDRHFRHCVGGGRPRRALFFFFTPCILSQLLQHGGCLTCVGGPQLTRGESAV